MPLSADWLGVVCVSVGAPPALPEEVLLVPLPRYAPPGPLGLWL